MKWILLSFATAIILFSCTKSSNAPQKKVIDISMGISAVYDNNNNMQIVIQTFTDPPAPENGVEILGNITYDIYHGSQLLNTVHGTASFPETQGAPYQNNGDTSYHLLNAKIDSAWVNNPKPGYTYELEIIH